MPSNTGKLTEKTTLNTTVRTTQFRPYANRGQQSSRVLRGQTLEPKLPRSKSQLQLTRYVTLNKLLVFFPKLIILCLSFISCKMGVIMVLKTHIRFSEN